MQRSLQQFSLFFKSLAQDVVETPSTSDDYEVSIVPKSESAGFPGDYVTFDYDVNRDGNIEPVVFLITRPITRIPGTGNLLFTGMKVPEDGEAFEAFGKMVDFGSGEYGPEFFRSLYRSRQLPMEYFRTYMFSKIVGNIIRISSTKTNKE